MTAIGMFDSGVGGLSVLRETRRLLPDSRIVYVADQAYGPYGDRTLDDVRQRADLITERLTNEGAGMIVIACHTASAAALHYLRERRQPLPVVGIEPAVKPAAERTATRTVGVLATTATFQGELFASVVSRFAAGTKVIARPCPGLADLVETGAERSKIERAVREHLEPFRGRNVDQIVLGCTHYSFLGDLIAELSGVQVVDPAPAVAAQVERVARQNGLDRGGSAALRLLTTGDPYSFRERVTALIGPTGEVAGIDV
ncbi:MAG TPA: glutamate racemase [Acidimicrobiia bacterium]|nr:glutamate racemase [Acidimicrobiia bacterium]